MTTKVGILVFDDVEELDAIGPYEVFGVAHAARPDEFEVFLVGAQRDRPVRCVNGLRVLPDHTLADSPSIDLLLIPGGVGTRRVATDEAVLDWIRATAEGAKWVASVCTGARVTLAAGLAGGRRITSHWSAIDELRRDGRAAEVLDDVRFVRDGNMVHSAGVSAGIDMSLWLIGQIADPALARQVQRMIEYSPAPPYAHEA